MHPVHEFRNREKKDLRIISTDSGESWNGKYYGRSKQSQCSWPHDPDF